MIDQQKGNKRRITLLIIAVVVQVLFLFGIAGSYYAVGWFGNEITIKTIPVDPRDFLYGDYVTLEYEITNLKPEIWKESDERPEQGEQVYVTLAPSTNGIYEATGIYRRTPTVQTKGQVVMKGIVASSWDQTIRVQYGLERYYVPEGTGKELERQAGNMIVHVKIAPWGQTRITGLEAMK